MFFSWTMKKNLSMVCGLAFVLGSSVYAADEIRIGTVDMQHALQTVDAGKKAKAQLEHEVTKKRTEIQSEEAAIKKMGEEFKKQSLVMSDEARAKKQNEIQERIVKYQELANRTQAELADKERKLTQPIIDRLKKIVNEVAKKKGYTMVLEKSDTTVLYSLEKDDLTQEVVSAYNKSPQASLHREPVQALDQAGIASRRLAKR